MNSNLKKSSHILMYTSIAEWLTIEVIIIEMKRRQQELKSSNDKYKVILMMIIIVVIIRLYEYQQS